MKILLKCISIVIFVAMGPLSLFAQTPQDRMEEVQLLADKGKYKKAVKICDEVIEKNPNFIAAYLNKSILLRAKGEHVMAIEVLSEGLASNKYSTSLYNARGLIFMEFNLLDRAMRDFDQGIKFADNDTLKYKIMLNKSAANIKKGEFVAAYDLLLKCLAFDSTDLNVLNNLAAICDEVGKSEMVMVYLMKVIESDSTFTSGYVNIGFHYQVNGQYEKSISYFDKALELAPYESLALNNRGYSKLMIGDIEGALEDVNHSLELFPLNPYAYRNLALIYIQLNKPNKVCEAIDNALKYEFTTQYGSEVLELQRKHCN